jgi:regulator of PEP synthase PpsR (kinase-PPPase family)
MSEIPIPLINYWNLIKNKKRPYYDIVEFLVKDMEFKFISNGQPIYTYHINPRILQEEIEKKTKDEKVTTRNVCRTVLAALYGSKLQEEKDFSIKTAYGGKRNYSVRINSRTLNSLSRLL